MKETSLLLKFTGDSPLFKIIDFLIENKGMDFTKKDIIEEADVSKASLFNYWGELEKYKIVKVTRSFGKTKLYILNNENPITKKLLELESTLIRQTMINATKKEELILA
ncbi:hypothetical protein HY483_00070 [Candidatus Woesearchaeota archaeon]|nr:hypothetical protein [Candidatus Woesearchaeota archaeon]